MSPAAIGCALMLCVLASADGAAEFSPPAQITLVTDNNYPPYLFATENGELHGIVKDKWNLWSQKTGVPVTVIGMTWAKAQDAVQEGTADVIEVLAYTEARTRLYEYSPLYAPVHAHVYFHRSISGINDLASMRGFAIGAKEGSACGDGLAEHGIRTLREYPTSESLVEAAGNGEVRLFCMDSMAAQYYVYKHELADDFRVSPPLYSTQFH